MYRASLHLRVELLVIDGGIVGPFGDERVGSMWIDRDLHLISHFLRDEPIP